MSRKPTLRVRRSGALLVAALIAFVGAVPLAGARWALTPILLVPFGVGLWAWRAGTDVYPDRLRVRALFGSTDVPWSRIAELAPDERGRLSALLDNGNVIRLTGVTTANLPAVLSAGGQDLDTGGQDVETGGQDVNTGGHDVETGGHDVNTGGRDVEISSPPPPD